MKGPGFDPPHLHSFCPVFKAGIQRGSCGRVVKALDLKSNGLCPRRFEPCQLRQPFDELYQLLYIMEWIMKWKKKNILPCLLLSILVFIFIFVLILMQVVANFCHYSVLGLVLFTSASIIWNMMILIYLVWYHQYWYQYLHCFQSTWVHPQSVVNNACLLLLIGVCICLYLYVDTSYIVI